MREQLKDINYNSIQENKRKIEHFWYVFFSIFSFIIIPVLFLITALINFKFDELRIGASDAVFRTFLSIIYSTIFCVISLIIFSIMLLMKKFHSYLLLIPFSLIFILVNASVIDIAKANNLFSNGIDIRFIIFSLKMNCTMLPCSYIPFVLLFGLILIFVYFAKKIGKEN